MNRDVQRVRDLLGPADPARSVPVGAGDPDGLLLDPAIDITPDDHVAPDGRRPGVRVRRRAPRLALAGAFAAVLATAGAVAVVTQAGGPGTVASPVGTRCLTKLATTAVDASTDSQTGRYTRVRVRGFSGPVWTTPSDRELWTDTDGSGNVWYELNAVPHPVGEDPRDVPNANALSALASRGRSGIYATRAERTDFLRALAANPGVRCAADVTDPLGRTGLAVTAPTPSLRAVPGTPQPIEQGCVPAWSACQATLIFDRGTGELLAYLESDPAVAGKVAYRAYSDRRRQDTLP